MLVTKETIQSHEAAHRRASDKAMLTPDEYPEILLDHILESTRDPVEKMISKGKVAFLDRPRRILVNPVLAPMMNSHDNRHRDATRVQAVQNPVKTPASAERPCIFEQILSIEDVGHWIAFISLVVARGQVKGETPLTRQTRDDLGTGQVQATPFISICSIHAAA